MFPPPVLSEPYASRFKAIDLKALSQFFKCFIDPVPLWQAIAAKRLPLSFASLSAKKNAHPCERFFLQEEGLEPS